MTLLSRSHVSDAAAVVSTRMPEVLDAAICAREATTHAERLMRLQRAHDDCVIILRALAAALATEMEAITPAEAATRCRSVVAVSRTGGV